MKTQTITTGLVLLVAGLNLNACASSTPPAADATAEPAPPAAAPVEAEAEVETAPLPPADERVEETYVEGVAGGLMVHTVTFEAAVVSVNQEKREAVLRGPKGNEVTVRVGKEAVNFYQVTAGDRVKVVTTRELLVSVNEQGSTGADGSSVTVVGVDKGQPPEGSVVSTSKVTAKISALDTKARTATLIFEGNEKQVFAVRPDVDMTQYKAGQEVIFLATEILALKVEKL